MSVLKFRRDRRQRGPFAAAPQAPRRAPQAPPAYDSRIDVDAAAAEIVEQAQAETRARDGRLLAGKPPWHPAAAPWTPDLLAEEAHRLYGWDITSPDHPPAHHRPYIPGVLGAEGRLSPRTAGVADDLGALPLFRDSARRMARPCCEQCRQAAGTWQERLYGTYRHHTWPVPEAAPREFGIATELRQAHGEAADEADMAEHAFASRYLRRAA